MQSLETCSVVEYMMYVSAFSLHWERRRKSKAVVLNVLTHACGEVGSEFFCGGALGNRGGSKHREAQPEASHVHH